MDVPALRSEESSQTNRAKHTKPVLSPSDVYLNWTPAYAGVTSV